jgi:NTE family protein
LQYIPEKEKTEFHLKPIPVFGIRPSVDLGTLASEQFSRFSPMIRYLLKGLGANQYQGWDLLSYLAFDEVYTKKLLKLGYDDLLNQEKEVRAFFGI